MIIYQARDGVGDLYTISRLRFPQEILDNLRDGRFEKVLAELKRLEHSCLRPIVDGGLDPIDDHPWVATREWPGESLQVRRDEKVLTPEDVERLEVHAKSVIAALSETPGMILLDPETITRAVAVNGEYAETFQIDYFSCFRDLAMGYGSEDTGDIKKDLNEFLADLRSDFSGKSAVLKSSILPNIHTPQSQSESSQAVPVLASAQVGNGIPYQLIIPLISVIMAWSGWYVFQKREPLLEAVPLLEVSEAKIEQSMVKTPAEIMEEETPEVPQKIEPASILEDIVTAQAPSEVVEAEVAPEPKVVTPPEADYSKFALMERPPLGTMSEISVTDAEQLQSRIDYWVILHGQLKGVTGNRELVFEGAELKVILPKGEITQVLGDQLRMIGILVDKKTLFVQKMEDIQDHIEVLDFSEKDVYAVTDERKIRTLVGQEITLSAEILGLKKSTSGKTCYLIFKKEKPEFAASVLLSRAGENLTEDFLESLIGKTIEITGNVKIENGWGGSPGRLLISLQKREQLAF